MEATNSTDSVSGAAETELECQQQGQPRSAILCPNHLGQHMEGNAMGPFCKLCTFVGSSAAVKCNAGAHDPVAKLLDGPVAKLHGCYGALHRECNEKVVSQQEAPSERRPHQPLAPL